jgi:hypothetical protein
MICTQTLSSMLTIKGHRVRGYAGAIFAESYKTKQNVVDAQTEMLKEFKKGLAICCLCTAAVCTRKERPQYWQSYNTTLITTSTAGIGANQHRGQQKK